MNVPIPARMKALDRDPRGYPIPWGVFRDRDGRPHFTINEEAKRVLALVEHLCPICGLPLLPDRWFVGGPRSAFDPNGAYNDPPMHRECMHYALKVCPYLAAPRYGRRIDTGTLSAEEVEQRIFLDATQIAERPVLFVAVMARDQQLILIRPHYYVRPAKPYIAVEYWQTGRRLPALQGERIARKALA
jgi:hypothetical protein